MPDVHVEALVEPFRENDPGPHVQAVVHELADAGLEPDLGPFATTASGDADAVADAVARAIRAGLREGATSMHFRVHVDED